jgi:enoyl-CoA hydratase/carnithine racemase
MSISARRKGREVASTIDGLEVTSVAISVIDLVGVVELQGSHVLNALHSSTHRAIRSAIDELEERADVGAILIRGAGRAFCSGSDLREIGPLRGEEITRHVQLDFSTKNRVAGCTKPVVAAIHGYCIGGGVELALACDLRVAAEGAVFSMREVTLGGIPGSGGLQRLPAVVGLGVAKDWILTGCDVSTDDAFARGLVTRVLPFEGFVEGAMGIARGLAKANGVAVRLAKAAMDPTPPSDYGLVAAYQALAGAECHADPDYEKNASRFS